MEAIACHSAQVPFRYNPVIGYPSYKRTGYYYLPSGWRNGPLPVMVLLHGLEGYGISILNSGSIGTFQVPETCSYARWVKGLGQGSSVGRTQSAGAPELPQLLGMHEPTSVDWSQNVVFRLAPSTAGTAINTAPVSGLAACQIVTGLCVTKYS